MEQEKLLAIMKNRRTIRNYLTEPVDEASLDRILQAATLPPTGAGLLPYVVIVVQDKERKQKIRQAAEKVETEYHSKVTGHLKDKFDKMGVNPEKQFLTDAPVLLVIAGDTTKPYWQESTWLAIAYMVLAIENEELGSLTYTPPDVSFLSQILKIPDNFVPQVVLPLGHIGEAVPPKRARPDGRIYFEEYEEQ